MAVMRAKFKLVSVTETKHWVPGKPNLKTLKLHPVSSGSPENDAFYASTPSGEIQLATVNADAVAEMQLGADYYVDFTPAQS